MRALVAGAGIAGLTTAWWLDRAGWDVVVVERSPEPRTSGYVIDFFGPGFEVAERMDLVPRLREDRLDVERIRYVDAAGRPRGHVAYDTFARAAGDRVLSIARGDLARALLEVTSVEVRWGAAVVGVRQEGARVAVSLGDGTEAEVDLLVGADGLHSRVRDAVVPGADVLRPLGYHTAAFRFTDPVVAELIGRDVRMAAVPGRQVAVYPSQGGLAAWLLHRSDDPLPGDPREAVLETYRGMGDDVDRVLARCTEGTDLYYDLVAQVDVDPWRSGRVVLVGDACQAPSLMAGQGASMAMAGAWSLADNLRRAGDDVEAGLAGYQAAMQPFAEERKERGRQQTAWMLPEAAWQIRLRQAVLALVRTPLSGAVMRRGFGADIESGLPA